MARWITEINTGQHLVRYAEAANNLREIATAVADELQKAELFTGIFLDNMGRAEMRDIIESFRLVTDDVEEMDDALSQMYDWGNYYRVWFTPVFEAKRRNDSEVAS